MAFDGLALKAISFELKNLIGYKIDKVFEPTKNDITLGLYGERTKLALNICIDSKFYRINLTTHPKPNPINSLNFCMLLRKHIIGYKIKDVLTHGLERIITFKLEPFDPNEDEVKHLIVELMGKHSNIILTDKNNIIIDSIRHTNISANSYRNIFPRQKYILPKSDKADFEALGSNFEKFYHIIAPDLQTKSVAQAVANRFIGFSLTSTNFFMEKLETDDSKKADIEKFFFMIRDLIQETNKGNVTFVPINDKDYVLLVDKNRDNPFILNYFIDDFYFEKETESDFISYRNNILKLILDLLKKYNKRLININNKLNECDNMETYKLYGELLTANLYKLNNQHLKSIQILNYYTNKEIVIPLNEKYNVNENSKLYFKKYNKLKNALAIVEKQKKETTLELQYIESIVYELENATTLEEVDYIFDEISENVIFKDKVKKSSKKQTKQKKKNEKVKSFSPLTFDVNGFTVLVGRNNKENDWLTIKHASSSDLWFHTKDIHGSHVILKTNGTTVIEDEVLNECAKLAASHSKGKESSNVPVDYCPVKYVKKPNGAKPGMVIYTHNKTLYVNP